MSNVTRIGPEPEPDAAPIVDAVDAIIFPHKATLATTAGKVTVTISLYEYYEAEEVLRFEYSGPRAALIECGAISAELMAPQRCGRRRVDEDGDEYQRQHYKHHSTVTRFKSLDNPSLSQLPGYLLGMIPAAQDALAAARAAAEQRKREEAKRNKPRSLEPEEWRRQVANHADAERSMKFMLRGDASDLMRWLAAGYRVRECDVLAILDCARRADAELTRLIGAMRIDRVNSPLRLVVNNA